jgi:radical SAM protein with 4Fe4S-binding SPASM domain
MPDRSFRLNAFSWQWTAKTDEDSLHESFSYTGIPKKELNSRQALACVDDLAALGCEKVCISGGPIFYRPDWADLARALVDKGIQLSLISDGNGFPAYAPHIAPYVKGVAVTLEGTQNTHDMIKRRSGSFERAVAAIRGLKERGVSTAVITTLSLYNLPEIDSIALIVKDLDAAPWVVRLTFSSGASMRQGFESYTVAPGAVLEIVRYLAHYRNKMGLAVQVGCDIGYFAEDAVLRPQGWSGCTAGIWSAALDCNGNVKGCLSMPDELSEGTVRKRRLTDIWNSKESFRYNRVLDPEDLSGYCRVCDYVYQCACGCPVSALASTGSRYDNLYCYQRLTREADFLMSLPRTDISAPSSGEIVL